MSGTIAFLLRRNTCVGVGRYAEAGATVHVDAATASALLAAGAGQLATRADELELDAAVKRWLQTTPSCDVAKIGR
jgi:hypothetical protein